MLSFGASLRLDYITRQLRICHHYTILAMYFPLSELYGCNTCLLTCKNTEIILTLNSTAIKNKMKSEVKVKCKLEEQKKKTYLK